MKTESNLIKYKNIYDELRKDFIEFSQRKSNFQIMNFISLSDSNIPSHIYRHTLVQIRVALSEIKKYLIRQERKKREKEKLEREKPENYDLDVLECEVEIEDLEYEILAKKNEIEQYYAILQKLRKEYPPETFTNEQYQKDEVLYWTQRLAKQLHDSVVDRVVGCGIGNLIALRDATNEYSDYRIPELPSDLKLLDKISKCNKMEEIYDLLHKKMLKSGDENEIYKIQAEKN